MERAYAIWRAFQDRFLAPAAALLLIGSTLLALLEVLRRYALGVSFEWQQDAVTFFILSGVFLYFSIAQRSGSHLCVEILVSALQAVGPRARRAAEAIELIALVISIVFLGAVVWWGIPEVRDSVRYGTRTESLALPMAPFLVVLLASFGLMAITMVFQIYRRIQGLCGRSVLVDPPDADAAPH